MLTQISGQSPKDSLIRNVQLARTDSAKAVALFSLADLLAFSNPDTSEILARSAISITEKNRFTLLQGGAYQNLALSFHVRGMLDSAQKYYLKAIPFHLENKDSLRIAGSFNNLGVTYNQQGNFPKSLKYYQESLNIKLALGQTEASSKTLNNMGIIYFDQKDYAKAMEYYLRALELERTLDNPKGLSRTLGNIGLTYLETNEAELALRYYHEAFQLVDTLQSPCTTLYASNGLGHAYSKLEKRDSAKYYLLKALNEARECQEQTIQTSTLLALGQIYEKEGSHEIAESYLLESAQIADQNNFKTHFKNANQALYEFYKNRNETTKALRYLEASYALRDSLFNEDLTAQLTTLELTFDFQQEKDSLEFVKQAEILTYDTKLKRQGFIQLITAAGLLIAVVLVIIIYRYNRLKQKANQELTVKNQQISEALAEREVLLQEVHHRVKNNLQVVSSLLNIQSKFLDNEDAKMALVQGRNRVISMSMIHEKLYKSQNLSKIDIAEYLSELVNELFDSYQIGDADITLKQDIEPVQLPLETSIHLGLIANELISNSLKYAFQNVSEGLIEISLKQTENQYCFMVKDNGPGVSGLEELEKSYGFRIVKSLVRGLSGTLDVDLSAGISIKVCFPGDH